MVEIGYDIHASSQLWVQIGGVVDVQPEVERQQRTGGRASQKTSGSVDAERIAAAR